jgi:hypothetical protein
LHLYAKYNFGNNTKELNPSSRFNLLVIDLNGRSGFKELVVSIQKGEKGSRYEGCITSKKE